MRPTVHLRHPDLDRVIDVPDDPGTLSALQESGWEPYEAPTSSHPALVDGEPGPDEDTSSSDSESDSHESVKPKTRSRKSDDT